MLISPPFLPDYTTEDDFLAQAIKQIDNEGTYPLSHWLQWHNGIHLQAPKKDGKFLPVCAIADGKVLRIKKPNIQTNDPDDPQNYPVYGSGLEWTDNGMVIIEHETAIGAAGGVVTEIKFCSAYMNLQKISPSIEEGKTISRKSVIGEAGQIYGGNGMLHLEICCDEDNLKKIVGNRRDVAWSDLAVAPTQDGRIDAIFGSIYIYLPSGVRLYPESNEPTTHVQEENAAAVHEAIPAPSTLVTSQWVKITYKGNATLESLDIKGNTIGQKQSEAGKEYSIPALVVNIHKHLPAAIRENSSPSGWFELYRFGRNLGGDGSNKDKLPPNAQHWRKIATPQGTVWADLNAPGTFKFSDADFLAIAGWQCVSDDPTPNDQRCDSPLLKKLLASTIADEALRAAAIDKPDVLESQLSQLAIQKAFKRLICKFPSEFEQIDHQARYGWIKDTDEFKSNPDNWNKLLRHIECITDVSLPSDYAKSQWHFHPQAFMETMRKCGWMSKAEFSLVYHSSGDEFINKYLVPFNFAARKYGMNTIARLPHFLGQGAIESGWLRSMQETAQELLTDPHGHPIGGRIIENSKKNESEFGHWWGQGVGEMVSWYNSDKYNSHGVHIASSYNWRNGNLGDPDAQKFRGRGFKQLTGLINYSAYWVFRGWLDVSSFDDNWWDDPGYHAKDVSRMQKRAPDVNNPDLVATKEYNCLDSGGWYMLFQRPAVLTVMDGGAQSRPVTAAEMSAAEEIMRRVTVAINGLEIGLPERINATKNAKSIILDYVV